MRADLKSELVVLQQKLLTMATEAEAAVNQAVRALMRRDDDLARQTREDDSVIDQLEIEIDDAAVRLLEQQPGREAVRVIVMAMRICRDLERVGDEATTISRRCTALSCEPPLAQTSEVPQLARPALQMLKQALDAFVRRNSTQAREVMARDQEMDALHRQMRDRLAEHMVTDPGKVERCLHLMVILKSLERIADHATNIAEYAVYLGEGRDIRHRHDTAA